MRILITGATGYLGGALANYLNNIGYEIVVAGRNKKKFLLPQNIEKVQIDWSNYESIFKACENIDIIIHAAGSNAEESNKNPKRTIIESKSNIKKIILAANNQNVKIFIYLSTIHVYKKSSNTLITEKTELIDKPAYVLRHIYSENLLSNSNLKFKSVILRLANIYGVSSNIRSNCWNLVINDFCRQAAKSGKIIIKSIENVHRDYLYLSEFCRIVAFVIKSRKIKKHIIINVTSGKSVSITDVIQKINDIFFKKIGINIQLEMNSRFFFSNIKNQKYIYSSAKLIKMGFKFKSKRDNSLVKLLDFCLHHFYNK